MKSQAGYSFIELLVVFSIMGIIGAIGMASFVSFGNAQAVDGAASEISNSLTIARQRALSQIKPSTCTAVQTLAGYRVALNIAAGTYRVEAVCGALTVPVSTKNLPPQVSFDPGSTPTVFFNVPNGTAAAPGAITINGFGKTKQITVTSEGIISEQ